MDKRKGFMKFLVKYKFLFAWIICTVILSISSTISVVILGDKNILGILAIEAVITVLLCLADENNDQK